MTRRAGNRIVVVGSCNMDLVVRVPRLPLPGETLAGTSFKCQPGGKGANQAVAAARLGGQVSLIGCVGTDAFGDELCAGLAADGIDVSHLHRRADVPTGIASITVSNDGLNSIVLAAGANGALEPRDIERAEALIAEAAVLLCQLEVPLQTVVAAIEIAARHQTLVVLNPAPAAPVGRSLLKNVDFLVPNESEAGLLTGLTIDELESAKHAGAALLGQGPRHVLLTLGARGVWMAAPKGDQHFPAPKVEATDSTAAGDTFIGGFAASIAAGSDLPSAILVGQRAAALSVTRFGAQTSIPYRKEVDEFAWT
jgi:ribokinase